MAELIDTEKFYFIKDDIRLLIYNETWNLDSIVRDSRDVSFKYFLKQLLEDIDNGKSLLEAANEHVVLSPIKYKWNPGICMYLYAKLIDQDADYLIEGLNKLGFVHKTEDQLTLEEKHGFNIYERK